MRAARTAGRLFLLLVSLLISVAVLEVAIRLFAPQYDPRRQLVFRRLQGYQGAAIGPINTTTRQRTPSGDYDLQVYFNQYGFRDDRDLAQSTSEDVFVLGDSFSMGWGVEARQRYSNLIEDWSRKRVFNIAIPADLRQYAGLLAYARDRGATISNLIVGICVDNDIQRYPPHPNPTPDGRKTLWPDRLRAELRAASGVYLALSWNLHTRPALRNFLLKLGIARDNPALPRDVFDLALRHTFDQQAIDDSVRMATEIRALADSNRTLFVIIPSITLWVGDNRDTVSRMHNAFVEQMRESQLSVLDLRPHFEAQEYPRALYFETDPHWNAKGHSLVARAIAQHLSNPGASPVP